MAGCPSRSRGSCRRWIVAAAGAARPGSAVRGLARWYGGAGRKAPSPSCRKRPFTTHADRAVDPLAVPVIEPAFRAALVPRVCVPPVLPLRGRAAASATVEPAPGSRLHRCRTPPGTPPRGTPRFATPRLWPSPLHECRVRSVACRRGVTWASGRTAWDEIPWKTQGME